MACQGSRAQFFRTRARAVRELAERSANAVIKRQLEIVAKEYELLAQMVAEGRLHC
jgi:hypothetical protein